MAPAPMSDMKNNHNMPMGYHNEKSTDHEVNQRYSG